MWLTQGNLYTKVQRATDAEVEWLRSKDAGLTYANKKTLFSSGEVEKVRFFDLLESHFPSGFLPTVLKRATDAGLKVELIDARTPPGAPPLPVDLKVEEAVARLTGSSWLRDYQQAAVVAAYTKARGIIRVPTGGGKTEIAIGLVKQIPCRWLFLVHRKTLMEQAAQRYELRCPDEEAGRVGEGRWKPRERFTVATFQTLATAARNKDPGARARLSAFLAGFQGVIIDECHVLPADSFWKVAMLLVNAYWRIGISGTPLDREDQRSVYAVAALGPIIYDIQSKTLIDEGRLALPIIRMVPVRQDFVEVDKDGLLKRWPWQKVYNEGVVRSLPRNRALLAATAKAVKPCLVFVKEIAHGKAFQRALTKRGIKSEFVWGDASLRTRQAAVKRLVRADIEVLVTSVIFQEGVDIPELQSVVIASGGKSLIAALQRIGRGMRTAAGKSTFEVWDVADDGNAWLRRHAKRRRHAYQREKYPVTVVPLVISSEGGGGAGTQMALLSAGDQA